MVGEPVDFRNRAPAPRPPGDCRRPHARPRCARDVRGLLRTRLGPIDLDLFPGEIVGIAGVAGNGQDELVACAAGLGSIAEGALTFAGADFTRASANAVRVRRDCAYLSADRAEEGLCLTASVCDNFVAGREQRGRHSRGARFSARRRAINLGAAQALEKLSVRYGRLTDAIRSLSGGNQQRVAIARELERRPKLLVAAQPTRGVDIAGIAFIHAQIATFRDSGGAVLLVSEELDEILALSDRIVEALYGGRRHHRRIVCAAEASVEKVGRLMLGQKAA